MHETKPRWNWIRCTSLGMCAAFSYVNAVYGAIEPASKFWQERKAAAQKLLRDQNPEPPRENTLLAQLPSVNLDTLSGLDKPLGSLIPTPPNAIFFLLFAPARMG